MDDLTRNDDKAEVWQGRVVPVCSRKVCLIEAGENRLMLIPVKD